LLTLEDKFYGSMAKGKQQMISTMRTDLQETKAYYGKLTNASTELFMKIWAERASYDKKVLTTTVAGGGAGAVGGVVVGQLVVGVLSATGGLAVLWPVVGVVVGAVAIAAIARKISSAKNMEEMELRVQEAINDFRLEVADTKQQMTAQILETIDAIFKRELDSTDKTFLDFRMSVNIDSKNIPLLEERIEKVNHLMDKIEQIEKERLLEC
jgi:uncharacterized protein YacL